MVCISKLDHKVINKCLEGHLIGGNSIMKNERKHNYDEEESLSDSHSGDDGEYDQESGEL